MTSEETLRSVSDARGLLDICSLNEIVTWEIHGRRAGADEDRADETKVDVQLMEQHSAERVGNRFRMVVATLEADIVADISAEYTLREPVDIQPAAIKEFVERVSVMAVYPYLREAVGTTAARLRVPVPTLDVLRAGEFEVTVGEFEASSGESTADETSTTAADQSQGDGE